MSRMLAAVVKKEVLHQVTSSRFVSATLILWLLALLAAVAGSGDYSRRDRNYQSHLEQNSRDLEGTHVYSFVQPLVAAEPEPLSILDRGFENWLGEAIQIQVSRVPMAASSPSDNDFMAGSPGLDLTTIVQLVLGLLALLLTFDAVVGEREAGTLRLVLANDVSRVTVVVGKFLGACVALLIALLSGTALTLAVMFLRAGIVLDATSWPRLGVLVAAYMAYLCLMVMVGLLISCRAQSTPSALAAALLTWLTVVFLVPQAAGTLAGELARAHHLRLEMHDDLRKLERQREEDLEDIEDSDPRQAKGTGHYAPWVKTKNGAEMRRFGTPVFYDRLAAYYCLANPILREHADDALQERRKYEKRQHRIEHWAKYLFWLSPASLVERVAESLAGTSSDNFSEHLRAAREHREELIHYLKEKDAFESQRWFTDDEDPFPWTKFVGWAPEDVGEAEYGGVLEEYRGQEVQGRVSTLSQQYDADPERRLALDDLPEFTSRRIEFPQAVRQVVPELSFLVLLSLILAIAVLGGIRSERPRLQLLEPLPARRRFRRQSLAEATAQATRHDDRNTAHGAPGR